MVITADIETRMLEKAQQDGVTLERQADGRFYTRSAKTPAGRVYVTTADDCSCPATAHCKHIAAVRHELEHGPLVLMVGTIECLTCRRCGVICWRGSIVFDRDPNAASCYDCADAVGKVDRR